MSNPLPPNVVFHEIARRSHPPLLSAGCVFWGLRCCFQCNRDTGNQYLVVVDAFVESVLRENDAFSLELRADNGMTEADGPSDPADERLGPFQNPAGRPEGGQGIDHR